MQLMRRTAATPQCAVLGGCTSIRSHKHPAARSSALCRPIRLPRRRSLQIVATSEHWWEDEEEFDSLTDALRPKSLLLVVAHPSLQAHVPALQDYFKNYDFNCGFSGSAEIDFATALWAGRDKPPLFLKMRRRPTLDAGERAEEFLAEVLQQNWRLDLDAGLGIEEPPAEHVLVVCSAEMAQALAQAATPGAKIDNDAAVALIEVDGTQAGDPAEWEGLTKRLEVLTAVGAFTN